ncbi:MAG: hypothetical protein OEM59_11010 [Rhodospirillales bacterium]|nr:hypothetical protein [Rhodospirillales bacterium]
MPKPDSVSALTELGRVRLSEYFFMREMLYSEVANFHGMSNMPEDPDLAIGVGKRLCEDILEPLHRAFGHVTVRSAFRSAAVNGFCNARYVESGGADTGYYCSDNTYGAARHIWDRRDDAGYMGGTVSVVIPWYLPRFERTGDPRPLAWWIKDNIPAYGEMIFFPWLCAFNIRWYEGPSDKAIILDDGQDEERLSDRTMANFDQDHSALYDGFPRRPG